MNLPIGYLIIPSLKGYHFFCAFQKLSLSQYQTLEWLFRPTLRPSRTLNQALYIAFERYKDTVSGHATKYRWSMTQSRTTHANLDSASQKNTFWADHWLIEKANRTNLYYWPDLLYWKQWDAMGCTSSREGSATVHPYQNTALSSENNNNTTTGHNKPSRCAKFSKSCLAYFLCFSKVVHFDYHLAHWVNACLSQLWRNEGSIWGSDL